MTQLGIMVIGIGYSSLPNLDNGIIYGYSKNVLASKSIIAGCSIKKVASNTVI